MTFKKPSYRQAFRLIIYSDKLALTEKADRGYSTNQKIYRRKYKTCGLAR